MSITSLLAVDPGLRGCGCAAFLHGQLYWVAYVKNPNSGSDLNAVRAMGKQIYNAPLGPRSYLIVMEFPQIYRLGLRHGADPNDLLMLAAVDSAIASEYRDAEIVTYLPREWKGQVPKEVHHPRVRSALNSIEQDVLETGLPKAKTLHHNVLDAVGLGLFHLGRMKK